MFTIFFGVVQIAVGIGASYVSRNVVGDALAIAGFTAGILLGVFALGVTTKRVGQIAALVGMCVGIGLLAFVKFGTSIAWPWYAIIGGTATYLTGLAVSFCQQRTEK